MIDFKKLIEAGVHFGHQTSRWSPKMAPFIWGYRNKVHLIDVSKTAHQLEKAAKFLESTAANGKTILWVGTKKPAQAIVTRIGNELESPYLTHRWIGGTLTNYSQVKKLITKLLHYEDILNKSDQFNYTKKELNTIHKAVERLRETVGGIRKLSWPIGAVVLVDIRKEQAALKESASLGIPIVALVDTNSDPTLVDYVIPANDDAPKSIKIILDYLAESVKRGKELAKKKKETVKAKAEEEKMLEAKKAKPAASAKKAKEVKITAKEVKTEKPATVKAKPKASEKVAAPKEVVAPKEKETVKKTEVKEKKEAPKAPKK